jgi:hypothetical protein
MKDERLKGELAALDKALEIGKTGLVRFSVEE